jgi:hypothetical protein
MLVKQSLNVCIAIVFQTWHDALHDLCQTPEGHFFVNHHHDQMSCHYVHSLAIAIIRIKY